MPQRFYQTYPNIGWLRCTQLFVNTSDIMIRQAHPCPGKLGGHLGDAADLSNMRITTSKESASTQISPDIERYRKHNLLYPGSSFILCGFANQDVGVRQRFSMAIWHWLTDCSLVTSDTTSKWYEWFPLASGQCPRHWAPGRWSGGTELSIHIRRHRCHSMVSAERRPSGRLQLPAGSHGLTGWFHFWFPHVCHLDTLLRSNAVGCCRSIERCRPVWNYLLQLDFVTNQLRFYLGLIQAYFGKILFLMQNLPQLPQNNTAIHVQHLVAYVLALL